MIRNKNSSSFWPASWPSASIFSLLLAGLSLVVASILALQGPPALSATADNGSTNNDNNQRAKHGKNNRIRVACLGNSIQYYNDCPRLLERMFQAADGNDDDDNNMQQNSCLRGGASIVSLFQNGNGMIKKFGTPNALLQAAATAKEEEDGSKPGKDSKSSYDIGAPTVSALLEDATFDYVIINDHTQSPARKKTREKTIRALKEDYAPLLIKSNIVPILLLTAAYRLPNIRGTSDLGSFEEYTKLLQQGTDTYKHELDDSLAKHTPQLQTRIAPVGKAYAAIYQSDRSLWEKLYHTDDFHPSPHGTLLQAFILFMAITDTPPPTTYDPLTWWDKARRMQPPDEPPLDRPTAAEAQVLRTVAMSVCCLPE